MHPPRQNRLISGFFTWYIRWIIARNFQRFSIQPIQTEANRAILLLSNHFSWWDGFLLFELNRLVLRKRFHVLVSEENYLTNAFMKYLGAFSVKKKSKSMLETFDFAGSLLNDPQNMVVVFPQGKLYSAHADEVLFEKGLMNIINASNKNFQYLFVAFFTDYFQFKKPTVQAYLQTWEGAEFTSLQLIKSEYNKHFSQSKRIQNQQSV